MALTAEQEALAKATAKLLGTTLHVIPQQELVQEYVALVKSEIDIVASEHGSGNIVADISEAVVEELGAIADVLPATAKGKAKFQHVVSIIKGFLKLFGL
jgi:hypothetical protein